MAPEEVGAYIRLLCYQWNRGSIPVDPSVQARLTGGCVSAAVLAKFSVGDDGQLKNQRLEVERSKRGKFLEDQKRKGLLSAEKRRIDQQRFNRGSTGEATESQPSGQPDAQPKVNPPSPSPTIEEGKAPSSPAPIKKERRKAEPFTPPTIEEAVEVCIELGMPNIEARKFINHHETKGWMIGNSPMRSWRAAMRTWHLNWQKFNQTETQEAASVSKPGWSKNEDLWKESIG